MGFPEIKDMDPLKAPMRWIKYPNISTFKHPPTFIPRKMGYSYYAKTPYDYTRAYYKYPEYRKLANKLNKSAQIPYHLTKFSLTPINKVENI